MVICLSKSKVLEKENIGNLKDRMTETNNWVWAKGSVWIVSEIFRKEMGFFFRTGRGEKKEKKQEGLTR